MVRKKVIFLIVGPYFLFTNCKINQPESVRARFAVFCFLEEGKSQQKIKIEPIHYFDSNDTADLLSFQIKIESELGNIVFFPCSESIGQYINNHALDWLIPLFEYKLLAINSRGDTLKGQTFVPAKFFICNHPETLLIQDSTKAALTWGKSETAAIYMLNFIPFDDGNQVSFFTKDTTINLFFYKDFFEKEGLYLLKVFALDKNTYQWELNETSSIVGGKGVFGAFTQDSTHFYLSK
ncbi:MAG: hypothetical protein ABIK93_06150 [candidate division WOR-3 bacterium]